MQTRSAPCGSPETRSRTAHGHDDVRRERRQFRRVPAYGVGIATAPANFEPHVLAVGPAQLCQRLQECLEACLRVRTKPAREHADLSHGLWLLRPRNHWPGHRITDKSEKLSPPHVRALVTVSDLTAQLALRKVVSLSADLFGQAVKVRFRSDGPRMSLRLGPLYPRKRTNSRRGGRSALCQERNGRNATESLFYCLTVDPAAALSSRMKSSATGFSVRFLSVTMACGRGLARKSIGSALRDHCCAL